MPDFKKKRLHTHILFAVCAIACYANASSAGNITIPHINTPSEKIAVSDARDFQNTLQTQKKKIQELQQAAKKDKQTADSLAAQIVPIIKSIADAHPLRWSRVLAAVVILSALLALLPHRIAIPPLVESDYCYLLLAADRLMDGAGLSTLRPVAPLQPWFWQGDCSCSSTPSSARRTCHECNLPSSG